MNKTLTIVQEWAAFEEKNQEASIEDFCRAYLKRSQRQNKPETKRRKVQDHTHRYALTKVIYRLSRLWMYFTMNEMKPMGLTSFDELLFLLTVQRSEQIRKKDLIYTHFIEISSGILVIDRLIKKGMLKEKSDDYDKRSKQVMITQKGKKVLAEGHDGLDKVVDNLYGDMPESVMLECFENLKPLLDEVSQRWNKLKKFEPVIEDVYNP